MKNGMKFTKLVGVVGVFTLALASCTGTPSTGEDVDASAGGGTTPDAGDQTFVFGNSGAPRMFDPFYSSDGETSRITDQMYEALLSLQPGTVEVAPSLATEWEASADARTWTFKLREGVKFHDGTDFNAEAVCYNFDRWYNQKGVAQSTGVTQQWSNDFGGFAGGDPSVYEACESPEPSKVVLKLTRSSSRFPSVLSSSAYVISSPTAMQKWDADNVTAQGDGFNFPEYAMSHPTGTGPFTFEEYDDAQGTVTLKRNEDYWGDPAKVNTLVFRIIPDETTRRQELEAGTIDAYDSPNPVDWAGLKDDGAQVILRDPTLNLLYVGINVSTVPALEDIRVRQALLYAIDRDLLVKTQLPEAAIVATQFVPPVTPGYNEDVNQYPFDTEKAKQLLKEAGHSDLKLPLWYPTEVSRPYMPDPKRVFEAVRDNWEAAGIEVVPVAKPWNGGYLDGREKGDAPTYILGTVTHSNNPVNFIGTFYGVTDNAFATNLYPFGEKLASDLAAADTEPNPDTRAKAYAEINAQLMDEYLPSLPIAHVPSAMAAANGVQGLTPSPAGQEKFAGVTVTRSE